MGTLPLAEYIGETKIRRGLTVGLNEAFTIEAGTRKRILRQNPQSAQFIHRVLRGKDILRYHLSDELRYLINIPKGWTRENCGDANPEEYMNAKHPALMKYLEPFAEQAQDRQDKGDFWWELRACTYLAEFQKTKIVYTDISKDNRFTLDRKKCHLLNSAYLIPTDSLYLLGILNSQLILFTFRHISSTLGSGGLRWIYQYISQLPIVPVAAEDPRRQTIEAAVREALALAARRGATLPGSQEGLDLDRRLAQLDEEIDEAVFALYGLTPEQCARVRGECEGLIGYNSPN